MAIEQMSGVLGTPLLVAYLAGAAFVFGAVVGSFLNVVIYRLHTGRSLAGSSHCLSCQRALSWYELIPLVSYLGLGGRCRACGSYIPSRYFVVELLTALSFLAIYLAGGTFVHMALSAVLAALLIVIAVYDVYHYVIPNDLVVYVSAVAVLFYGADVAAGAPLSALAAPLYSGAGAALFFGSLWKVSSGRWIGFGDVKLAAPLGALASFPAVFSMVVLAFWVGAAVSIALLAAQALLQRGQKRLHISHPHLTIKSEIPFAPFLITGFVLSHFYGVDVLSLVAYVL